MSFIDSYKRLEKLCSEIYNDNHGISSYIDEMISTPIGARYVPGWDDDLKQLKHYRWVRNQIVHEPGCTEADMCEPDDAEWINNFHSRIMTASDPLAQYRKARTPKPTQRTQQTYSSELRNYTYSQWSSAPQNSAGCLTFIVGILLVVAAVILTVSVI